MESCWDMAPMTTTRLADFEPAGERYGAVDVTFTNGQLGCAIQVERLEGRRLCRGWLRLSQKFSRPTLAPVPDLDFASLKEGLGPAELVHGLDRLIDCPSGRRDITEMRERPSPCCSNRGMYCAVRIGACKGKRSIESERTSIALPCTL